PLATDPAWAGPRDRAAGDPGLDQEKKRLVAAQQDQGRGCRGGGREMRGGERFDFDTPIDRRGTASEKWERYAGRDILPLWVADMDFRSPPAVIDALHGRVDHGVFGYTAPPADLVETVLAMLQREYGWPVSEEWLVWLPGLVCGLNV